jgi:N6-L-threonylcarbamoyladenine synthase
VLNYLNQKEMKKEKVDINDVAASFQAAVVEVLTEKTIKAAVNYGVETVLLAGGVAANGALREALNKRCAQMGMRLIYPPIKYCTDNASMIGAAAYYRALRGQFAGLGLNAVPNLPLSSAGR